MDERVLTVAMNGVTGRMGYRQHRVRSVLAIREQGGVELRDGSRVQLEPVLVGRNEAKLRHIACAQGLERWTTDLDQILQDAGVQVYFDAQSTSVREPALVAAMDAGKHIYTEKPVAGSFDAALRLAAQARSAGVKNGVVHDELYLPVTSTSDPSTSSSTRSAISVTSRWRSSRVGRRSRRRDRDDGQTLRPARGARVS